MGFAGQSMSCQPGVQVKCRPSGRGYFSWRHAPSDGPIHAISCGIAGEMRVRANTDAEKRRRDAAIGGLLFVLAWATIDVNGTDATVGYLDFQPYALGEVEFS